MNSKFISLIKSNKLKYGCNPYQDRAGIYIVDGNKNIPFNILNGDPGYINILDAVNSWYLVSEIMYSLEKTAAASFKHVSPAGVAFGLTALEAYQNARECDPRSSFGDFIAINTHITKELAVFIKSKVSDGIIAPSYSDEAFEILKSKKNSKYIILKGKTPDFKNQEYMEYRIFKNICLTQKNNPLVFERYMLKNIMTENINYGKEIEEDIILANITLKYTQSNSVCVCFRGKTIGIGAGQQSRIDCVKLAKRKAEKYLLRLNKDITNKLIFKKGVKYQQRVNATIQYIENDMSENEKLLWNELFEIVPPCYNDSGIDKQAYFKTLDGISISSDGFFPFRDSIDQSSLINIQYIAQPGGSVADKDIISACNEYNMLMFFTDIRLFHH
jgi:phosphoribosylaminoimidazolecarboxamide formyltransferase / IMP cyclohydrolase